MKRAAPRVASERLVRELASLPDLPRPELLARWRVLYGTEPPAKISRPLLILAVGYRMQEKALGGLRQVTRRALARAAENLAAGKSTPTKPPPSRLRPGTRCLREWQGKTYEAIIVEDGVLLQGKHYRSLSEAARAITGARWSGPRFFGLRSSRPDDPA